MLLSLVFPAPLTCDDRTCHCSSEVWALSGGPRCLITAIISLSPGYKLDSWSQPICGRLRVGELTTSLHVKYFRRVLGWENIFLSNKFFAHQSINHTYLYSVRTLNFRISTLVWYVAGFVNTPDLNKNNSSWETF